MSDNRNATVALQDIKDSLFERPVTWHEPAVLDFWRFVAERHRIFVRRVLWQAPPPWTDDPILASVRFTNVYRDLDRLTRYVIVNILRAARTGFFPARDVFWNVLAFRFFNWIPTYEALGGFRSPEVWNPEEAIRLLVERQKHGLPVFTAAYMVQAIGARPGLGGKVELVVTRLEWARERLSELFQELESRNTMEQAHQTLCHIPGIAAFNAYEILIDLCYDQAVLRFSEDDWLNPGPGALKGLRVLAPDTHFTRELAQEAIKALRWAQEAWLAKAGEKLLGPPLTLRNVEHSLCEYSKYVRAWQGGHAKRRFRPEAASQDLSLWDDLPSQFVVPRRVPLAPMTDG